MDKDKTDKSYDLSPGDIVFDLKNNEIGFLIKKFALIKEAYFSGHLYPAINAWDILWTGPHLSGKPRRPEAYTEDGIINMLNNGVLVLFKDI